jgi:hypothetical protein
MFVALFSVMLVASEGAAATEVTPPVPIATEAAEAERKICKRERVTGQIQGTKRVCMTAEQWKRVREANEHRR